MSIQCSRCGGDVYLSVRQDRLLHIKTGELCPVEIKRRRWIAFLLILLGILVYVAIVTFTYHSHP